jgi:hypothetical protein
MTRLPLLVRWMPDGFFLKIMLSPYGRSMSEESGEKQIVLSDPIGVIQYRGSPSGGRRLKNMVS